MTARRPLVLVSGAFSELPQGDSVLGTSAGDLTAGSGLDGGGDLDGSTRRFDISLAPNASGLIFVGSGESAQLGIDGAALAASQSAITEDAVIGLIIALS
jgi:hypothetical protein